MGEWMGGSERYPSISGGRGSPSAPGSCFGDFLPQDKGDPGPACSRLLDIGDLLASLAEET